MNKFEEEFNYLIELSGKVLIGQVDAEAFEKNRIAFFEKYETDQQQPLPVVPECVDKEFKRLESTSMTTIGRIRFWTGDTVYDLDDEVAEWVGDNEETILRAMLDGYTVEKPQMFYLKDNLTGMYLYKIMIAYNEGIKGYKWNTPTKKGLGAGNYKFTQAEINSMQTGSYEQIEVVE